jgi:hypothetical protein
MVCLDHNLSAHGPEQPLGTVVGNIISEWTQILGLVWMTKILMEVGSKEAGAVKLAQKPRAGDGQKQS